MKKNNESESVEVTEKVDVDVYDVASKKATLFAINDDDEIAIRKFMMLKLLKKVLKNTIQN